jgi:hypothetical protein
LESERDPGTDKTAKATGGSTGAGTSASTSTSTNAKENGEAAVKISAKVKIQATRDEDSALGTEMVVKEQEGGSEGWIQRRDLVWLQDRGCEGEL